MLIKLKKSKVIMLIWVALKNDIKHSGRKLKGYYKLFYIVVLIGPLDYSYKIY